MSTAVHPTPLNASDVAVVAQARGVFGDPLAEVIASGRPRPTRGVDAVVDALGVPAVDRLRAALRIADDLLALEDRDTVQSWFVGQNPMLDDGIPALVLSTDPDAVRRAAQRFVAYG